MSVERLECLTCGEIDLAQDDLCHHRTPVCLRCCFGGEHGWDDDHHYGSDAA